MSKCGIYYSILLETHNTYQNQDNSKRHDLTNWFLGVNYLELNEPKKAKPLLVDELHIQQLRKGSDNAEYGVILSALARSAHELGDFEIGSENFNHAIEIIKNDVGESHKFYGMMLYYYACAMIAENKNTKADEYLKKSIDILKESEGDKDHNTVRSKEKLNYIH